MNGPDYHAVVGNILVSMTTLANLFCMLCLQQHPVGYPAGTFPTEPEGVPPPGSIDQLVYTSLQEIFHISASVCQPGIRVQGESRRIHYRLKDKKNNIIKWAHTQLVFTRS